METAVFLAKLVGLTLVVVGAAIVLRRRSLLPVFAGYVEQHLLRFAMSMIELAVGLGLVVHNAWSPVPAAVMTLLGWLMVVEAVFYMLVPDHLLAGFMAAFNTEAWYVVAGGFAMVVGLYLAGFGFGWW